MSTQSLNVQEGENVKINNTTVPNNSVDTIKSKPNINEVEQLEELIVTDDPPSVIKSPSDPREYATFTLDNQLKVLVISDPQTTKSAAALTVLAGSLLDPKELPGLAHLCQNLMTIHNRDDEYSENAFQKFITTNGGDYHAMTNRDSTLFSFDISSNYFDHALPKFAAIFQNPISFTDDDIEKGIKAVQLEFEKNLPLDDQRRTRVEQFCSKIDHPYGQFDCGNTLSLWTHPQSSSINLGEMLTKFYNANYSANLMHLVILSQRSCAELEIIVEDIFGGITNSNIERPTWPQSPYGVDQLTTKIELVPILNHDKVYLIFPVPDYTEEYKTGLIPYINFILSHEGPQSLLALFREENWARRLVTEYSRPGKGFAFFSIDIELIRSGLKNINNVIHHVFQFLKMMRLEGPQKWIWNELKFMRDAKFQFLDKESPLSYVKNLVNLMPNYPPHHYLIGKYIIRDYKPKLIRDFMECLTVTNSRIIISTKQNDEIADEVEEWYGAKYKYRKIDKTHIKKWKNCVLHDDLQLPNPNQFIPNSFHLKDRDSKATGTPRLIEDNAMSRVWFMQDNEFNLPTATIILAIQSPLPKQQANYFNSTRLIEKVMTNSLTEISCDAKNAGLISKIEATLAGLTITTHGYDNKLPTFFEMVLNSLFNFCSVGKVGMGYQEIKDEYTQYLTDWREEEPYIHAVEYIWELLNSHTWSPDQLLQAMSEDISPFHLMNYGQQFLSHVKLVWVFYGNLTEAEALEVYKSGQNYFDLLGSQPIPSDWDSSILSTQEAVLPPQTTTVYSAEHHFASESCAVILHQTGHGNAVDTVMTELTESLLKGPALQYLRKEEQIVWTEVRKSRATLGIQIILQDEKDPTELENKIEEFLYNMEQQIEVMSETEFLQFKKTLLAKKLEKPKTMKMRSLLIFDEILRDNYFQRQTTEINELEKIQLKDIIKFYKDKIVPDGPSRKTLCVQVASALEKDTIVLLRNNSTDANPPIETKSIDQVPSNEPPQSKETDQEIDASPKIGVNQSPVDGPLPNPSKKSTPNSNSGQGQQPHASILKKPSAVASDTKTEDKKKIPSTHISFADKLPEITGQISLVKIQRPKSAGPNSTNRAPTSTNQRPRTALGHQLAQKPSLSNQTTNRQGVKDKLLQLRYNLPAPRRKSGSLSKKEKDKEEIFSIKWSPQMNKSFVLRENSIIAKSVTSGNLSFTERPQGFIRQRQSRRAKEREEAKENSRRNPSPLSNLIKNNSLENTQRFGPRISFRDNSNKTLPRILQDSPYNRRNSKSPLRPNVNSDGSNPGSSGLNSGGGSGVNNKDKDTLDIYDYDFDFDEEINRLKYLKKFLKHKEAEAKGPGKDSDGSLTPGEMTPKPEVKPGFNLQTEIRRLRNLRRILDEDIFRQTSNSLSSGAKKFVALKNNPNDSITVHDVEKELQRLKNIKKYLDGETKELNLHQVEYTVFVLNQVKLNDNKGAKELIARFLESRNKQNQIQSPATPPPPKIENIPPKIHTTPFFHTSTHPITEMLHQVTGQHSHNVGPVVSIRSKIQNSTSSKLSKGQLKVNVKANHSTATKLLREIAVKEMKTGFSKIKRRNSDLIVVKKNGQDGVTRRKSDEKIRVKDSHVTKNGPKLGHVQKSANGSRAGSPTPGSKPFNGQLTNKNGDMSKKKRASSTKAKIPLESKTTKINLKNIEGPSKKKEGLELQKGSLSPKKEPKVAKIKLEGKVTTINLGNMEQVKKPETTQNLKDNQAISKEALKNSSKGQASILGNPNPIPLVQESKVEESPQNESQLNSIKIEQEMSLEPKISENPKIIETPQIPTQNKEHEVKVKNIQNSTKVTTPGQDSKLKSTKPSTPSKKSDMKEKEVIKNRKVTSVKDLKLIENSNKEKHDLLKISVVDPTTLQKSVKKFDKPVENLPTQEIPQIVPHLPEEPVQPQNIEVSQSQEPNELSLDMAALNKLKQKKKMETKKKKKVVIMETPKEEENSIPDAMELRHWMNKVASTEMQSAIKSLTHKKKLKQHSAISLAPVVYHPPNFLPHPSEMLTIKEAQRLKELQNQDKKSPGQEVSILATTAMADSQTSTHRLTSRSKENVHHVPGHHSTNGKDNHPHPHSTSHNGQTRRSRSKHLVKVVRDIKKWKKTAQYYPN